MSAASLANRVRRALASYYGLDVDPPIDPFISESDDGAREALVVESDGDDLQVALYLPSLPKSRALTFDELCQIVEGVSHFMYLVERARRELPATQLELELQAEIDKFVLLTHALLDRDVADPSEVRARLFDRVRFLHPEGTLLGDRYRLANDVAARFAHKLEREFARRGRYAEMRAALRRFYGAGQTEKLSLARAA